MFCTCFLIQGGTCSLELYGIWNICTLAWIYSGEFLSCQIQIFLFSFHHPGLVVAPLVCWLAVCCSCQLIQGGTCSFELSAIWNVRVLAWIYSREFFSFQIQFFFLFAFDHPGLMAAPVLWNVRVWVWMYSCEFLLYHMQIFLLALNHPGSMVAPLLY